MNDKAWFAEERRLLTELHKAMDQLEQLKVELRVDRRRMNEYINHSEQGIHESDPVWQYLCGREELSTFQYGGAAIDVDKAQRQLRRHRIHRLVPVLTQLQRRYPHALPNAIICRVLLRLLF